MKNPNRVHLHLVEDDGTRFEKLVGDLLNRFTVLGADELLDAIENALPLIGQIMESDRCYFFLLSDDGSQFTVTHLWHQEGIDDDPVVVGAVVSEGFPWLADMMMQRQDIVIPDLDTLPPEAQSEADYARKRGIQSFLMCPVQSSDMLLGNIGIDVIGRQRPWIKSDIRRLRMLGEIIAFAIACIRKDREIQDLRDRLEAENIYLRKKVLSRGDFGEIVGKSEGIENVLRAVEQVAPTAANVLILGETGTGKELIARAIHERSDRRERPLFCLNCAALATTLIESELFGREKGAYTGALTKQIGRFELADGSTLLLDEVGELPLEVQGKLLRVLESGTFERLGSPRTITVDVRLIAASNRDLAQAVRDKTFREDLYYRLNVFPLTVPPLRERSEDIPQLVWTFVKKLEESVGRRIEQIPTQDIEMLARYPWPGNIRELMNVVERAMILGQGPILRIAAPNSTDSSLVEDMTLEQAERKHINAILEQTGWRVRGRNGAAERLGLKPTTLESKMRKLDINRGA